jgi:orotate phosphoribosyltransferase-like protein
MKVTRRQLNHLIRNELNEARRRDPDTFFVGWNRMSKNEKFDTIAKLITDLYSQGESDHDDMSKLKRQVHDLFGIVDMLDTKNSQGQQLARSDDDDQ